MGYNVKYQSTTPLQPRVVIAGELYFLGKYLVISWESIIFAASIQFNMSLGFTVNREKNGALLAYIAKNVPNISLRKLLKIVYLIDEKFMKKRGFPLTWFDYYAWAKGPVAPEVYEVKNGAFSEYVTCHRNEDGTNIIDAVLPHPYLVLKQMDLYSPYEMGIIDQIVFEYENTTADELSELTHKEDTLWSQIVKENAVEFVEGKSDVQIPLMRLNEGDVEKEETYEEALEYMKFCGAAATC